MVPRIGVEGNLKKLNLLFQILQEGVSNVSLIKGKVDDTLLTESIPEKISILRLDTDFYESTKIELEVLWPRLGLD